MTDYIDHSFQTPFGEIAARTWGNGHKKILAIHGWLDNLESFTPLAQALSDDYQLTAIDLPGHGLSYHHQDKLPYHFIDYPLHLAFILKELDFHGTLIGHSMGAAIAILVTANFPEHVKELVLIDGIAPIFCSPEENATQLRKTFEHYQKSHNKKRKHKIDLQTATKLRLQANKIKTESAELLSKRNLSDKQEWNYDRFLKAPSPLRFSEEQIKAYLQAIHCPSTIITATQNKLINKSLESLKQYFNAPTSIHRIPADHHLHMDLPEQVAHIIRPPAL